KLAARVAEASPLVIAIGKQAFYTQIDLDQQKAYAYAKEVMSMNALAADAQEGMAAFLGTRAACWSGKEGSLPPLAGFSPPRPRRTRWWRLAIAASRVQLNRPPVR